MLLESRGYVIYLGGLLKILIFPSVYVFVVIKKTLLPGIKVYIHVDEVFIHTLIQEVRHSLRLLIHNLLFITGALD